MNSDIPVLEFLSDKEFEDWISKNSDDNGLWLKIAKKASDIQTVTYAEALDVALCYGWIDGQRKKYDDTYFIQKFTPRRARSIWSKRNIGKIAELKTAGRMTIRGDREVQLAKQDGRWEAAYDSPKNMEIPHYFLEALAKNKKAEVFFESLSKSNKYYIFFQLTTAKKPETRQRRMDAILSQLEEERKF